MASGYYDITNKTLGKGHYGVVKLGRHCLSGEPVAIKIIEKSRLNPDSLNQLGTEIRILFRLSEYEHPNILKLYQTIDTEDKLYLITEYCGPHACDLHDYLSRKHCRDGLSEIEAQIFFIQICSAISYCHSMGIVHRDLKPENILVTDYNHMNSKYFTNEKLLSGDDPSCNNNDSRRLCELDQYPLLKLIDFGFANQWYADEKMRTSCGTLAYSAPELLLGEPYDGTKVDVWGLGLMLYILLYGGNPFMQINDNETLTKILDCSFVTPKRTNVDYHAVELLGSLIKRNPDTRLPIDAILHHKWFTKTPKSFGADIMKYQNLKKDLVGSSASAQPNHTSPSTPSPLQLAQMKPASAQNMSTILPSINELGPLKSLDRSTEDHKTYSDYSEKVTCKPNYNRTRSLSITRSHSKSNQQKQITPLTQCRSSLNLERLTGNNPSTPARGSSIYRPTSPDVGGSSIVLTEEESHLHTCVIQEMFRLTKLIDSQSSIEASLKNARFTHRQFNQNSIQPAVLGKKKFTTGLVQLLGHSKNSETSGPLAPEFLKFSGQSGSGHQDASGSTLRVDKLGMINTKLSNDDYIYATYQLTRDRLLRIRKDKFISSNNDDCRRLIETGTSSVPACLGSNNQSVIIPEEILAAVDDSVIREQTEQHNNNRISAKENDRSRIQQQRKLLQPQHKIRDKFTSFFRSGSTSPNGSLNLSYDCQNSGDGSLKDHISYQDTQHEAFSDQNIEHSATGGPRYYPNKVDAQESCMAYALPLARKCSLVSEESGCSNELAPDS